jgi:hypothetical protein
MPPRLLLSAHPAPLHFQACINATACAACLKSPKRALAQRHCPSSEGVHYTFPM